jgi:hypothetical protein
MWRQEGDRCRGRRAWCVIVSLLKSSQAYRPIGELAAS